MNKLRRLFGMRGGRAAAVSVGGAAMVSGVQSEALAAAGLPKFYSGTSFDKLFMEIMGKYQFVILAFAIAYGFWAWIEYGREPQQGKTNLTAAVIAIVGILAWIAIAAYIADSAGTGSSS